MIDFDVQAFLSLPRTYGALERGGEHCAVGAFNHVTGRVQVFRDMYDLIGTDTVLDIVTMNDRGMLLKDWKNFESRIKSKACSKDGKKYKTFTVRAYRLAKPNYERASRMLIEAVRGKVNFINEGLVFETPTQTAEIANV